MVLLAALDKGYIFISLIGILTSVISAVYYLVLVKVMFFEKSIYSSGEELYKNQFSPNIISMSSYLSFAISILTLFILLFMFFDQELIRLVYIIT